MKFLSPATVAMGVALLNFMALRAARATSTLTLNFVLAYDGSEIPSNPFQPSPIGYIALPELESLPDPQLTATEVYSPMPGQYFYGRLDAGETVNFSAQSSLISSFSDYKDALNSTGWTLRTNADSSNPGNYSFNVNASSLTNFAATPAMFAAGTQGASLPANSQPTFHWTGPTGFDSVSFQLYVADGGPTVETTTLDGTATSHTLQNPLAPGTYQLALSYLKDVSSNSPMSVSTPTHGTTSFANWGGTTYVHEEVDDVATFTVVPEPANWLLLATGVILLTLPLTRKLRVD